jgi:lipoyl(octanoyl) transferase
VSERWLLVDTGPCPAAYNMALDEAFLLGVSRGGPPVLRFYDWSTPTISIGFNQRMEREVDLRRALDRGYEMVRRPTGGRAVLHKQEITYAVAAPVSGNLLGGVTETYARISRALVDGLLRLGVPAVLEEGRPQESRTPGNPCFTSVSRFEISVNNRKLVGSAQVRKGDALLQHGSIQLHWAQEEMADLLPDLDDRQRERFRRFLAAHSTSIDAECGREVPYEEAVRAFQDGFHAIWPEADFEPAEPGFWEAGDDFQGLCEKYVNEEWNRR